MPLEFTNSYRSHRKVAESTGSEKSLQREKGKAQKTKREKGPRRKVICVCYMFQLKFASVCILMDMWGNYVANQRKPFIGFILFEMCEEIVLLFNMYLHLLVLLY